MSKNRSYSKVLSDLSDLAPKEDSDTAIISEEVLGDVSALEVDTVEQPTATEHVATEVDTAVASGQQMDTSEQDTVEPEAEIIIPAKTAIDHSGNTVIKPAVTINAPAQVAQEEVLDKHVGQLRQLIDVYLKFNDGDIIRNREDTERAGTLFRTTLKYVMDYPTVPVMDEMYKFFKIHRNRILAPKFVFPSIITMPKQMAERMSCVYTLFSMMVTGSTSINESMLRELLGKSFDAQKTEAFLIYFDQKTK